MSRNRTVKILMFGVFSLVLGAAAGPWWRDRGASLANLGIICCGICAESCRSDCGAGKLDSSSTAYACIAGGVIIGLVREKRDTAG